MSDLGIVIIGRNEGQRLVRCLKSITVDAVVVYVDSGSSDESVAAARSCGAKVIELPMSQPFTAARARNAGRAALPPTCSFVQFLDGDCALQPGWLATARRALDANERLAAAFGRRREIEPGASWYNWLCDLEWAVPPGPARYFGGDVMLRTTAFDEAGGYPAGMIAGEEPDLAIRLRSRGWQVECLPHEMTLHDAAIFRFGQYWRRAQRSGHAYAELAARNHGSPLQDYSKRLRGVLIWGAALPLAGLVALAFAFLWANLQIAALSGVIFALPLAQFARLTVREARERTLAEALALSALLMVAKPAQASGILKYWHTTFIGGRSKLIEYK